jgi:hypothetical protein
MSRKPILAASFGARTEKAFKTIVENDRFIDNLRSTEYMPKSLLCKSLTVDISLHEQAP